MDPVIAAIIGALVGSIATGVVSYYLSSKLMRHQEYNKAAAIFRESFLDEIFKLKKVDTDVINIINETTLHKHEKARIIFEPYLSQKSKVCLNNIWIEYTRYANLETQEVAPGNVEIRKSEAEKSLGIINKILLCANPE